MACRRALPRRSEALAAGAAAHRLTLMGELDGHVALVTGAARGIGAAIAQRLAAGGAKVCVADVDDPGEVADGLCDAGHAALAARLDVADPASCDAAAKLAADELGPPTILVNNAGVMASAFVHKMADRQWDAVHDVCLRGTFNGVRAVAPWFRDRDGGPDGGRRIVNITSIAGIYGGTAGSNYISAKAGVIGMTKAMAAEWAPFGVTVNAVAPGLIATRMGDQDLPADLREGFVRRIPLGRVGTPEDIAAAVGFLCSPEASYVTSQVLEVAGGLTDLSPPTT